jgi:polycomb protein EED
MNPTINTSLSNNNNNNNPTITTTTTTTTTTPRSHKISYNLLGKKKVTKSDLYSVSFRHAYEDDPILVTVGANVATIFLVHANDNGLKLIHEFVDQDVKEDFYCCEWSLDSKIFLLAGERGIIKGMDFENKTLQFALIGHGDAIHEVKRHPTDGNRLFSCSTDESVRMWNIRDRRAICMFVGDQGHRDAVLSIDIHSSGKWLISSGIDNTIKIWNLEKIQDYNSHSSDVVKLASSFNDSTSSSNQQQQQPQPQQIAFKPAKQIQFPEFSTRSVHPNYVDCVRFVGDLVISKSLNSKLWLWAPDVRRRPNSVTLLRELCYPASMAGKLWYERFSLNTDASRVIVGGDSGGVVIFDVDSGEILQKCPGESTFTGSVRSTAFSPNGAFVVATCANGNLWCWYDKKHASNSVNNNNSSSSSSNSNGDGIITL